MSQTERRRVGTVAAWVLAAVSWVLSSGVGLAVEPLSADDLLRFLKAGISEQTILTELASRGLAEPIDETREAGLRASGASDRLIAAARQAASESGHAVPGTGHPPGESAPPAGRKAPLAEAPPSSDLPATSRGGRAEPTFSAGTRTVRVPVSVLDKEGKPVLGLKGEDFRISEDGKPQTISLFSGERRPLKIVLALDISRSMNDKMPVVKESLRHFIDILEPSDEIQVMTFNDDVTVVQPFTSDRRLLGRVLDALTADGGTALYDAAFQAIQWVASDPAESKAVVLVTDGVDTQSQSSLADVRELARRTEVPVFSIGLDSGAFRPELMRAPGATGGWPGRRPGSPGGWGGPGAGWPGRDAGFARRIDGFDAAPLRALADDTGARVEIVKSREPQDAEAGQRLHEAVESIATILRHRYLLGYEPPSGKRDWRKIQVQVDRADSTARARKGYYAGA